MWMLNIHYYKSTKCFQYCPIRDSHDKKKHFKTIVVTKYWRNNILVSDIKINQICIRLQQITSFFNLTDTYQYLSNLLSLDCGHYEDDFWAKKWQMQLYAYLLKNVLEALTLVDNLFLIRYVELFNHLVCKILTSLCHTWTKLNMLTF